MTPRTWVQALGWDKYSHKAKCILLFSHICLRKITGKYKATLSHLLNKLRLIVLFHLWTISTSALKLHCKCDFSICNIISNMCFISGNLFNILCFIYLLKLALVYNKGICQEDWYRFLSLQKAYNFSAYFP